MQLAVDAMPTREEFCEALLNALWLRPESALWYSHMLYEARRLLGPSFASPSLDLGCMDAVNSFVLLGGRLGRGFDVYSEVRWDLDAHKRSTIADDYFDVISDEPGAVEIAVPASGCFDIGLDWKSSHIEKARRLGVHRRFIQCQASQPLEAVETASVATVWAPNIYWLDDLVGVASELRRIITDAGRIVTIVPDRAQLDCMLYRFAGNPGMAWLKDLDRERYKNASKQARHLPDWEALFDGAGLEIADHQWFIPSIVGQVYDIGLRPMFPVFMNIHESLRRHSIAALLELKDEWIGVLRPLLAPLCDVRWMDAEKMHRLWHVFELHARKA